MHERGRYFALDSTAHYTEKSVNYTPENVAKLRAAWGRFWNESKSARPPILIGPLTTFFFCCAPHRPVLLPAAPATLRARRSLRARDPCPSLLAGAG